uniref:Putative ADP-ribosylation factor GTPase activating protein n=1 Tax=Trypanosoma congolense (strain IL3000) TaxID=1068625 RepID=G0UKI9_TRYCI|nr:putative ADP-ribosylation factor GTPase activating protein [Trypanosoma congolense IL3000]
MSDGKEHKHEDKKKRGRRRSSHHPKGSDSRVGDTPATSTVGLEEEETEDWEANRVRIEQICQSFPNDVCNDCNNNGTRWASVNNGVFLCIRCSGIHRSLGVHISKVKSTNMDKWSESEIRLMDLIGNQRAKLLFEARLPKDMRPMTHAEPEAVLRTFIQRKYQEKAFAVDGVDEKLRQYHKDARYGKKPKKRAGESRRECRDDKPSEEERGMQQGEEAIKALYGQNAEVISKKLRKTNAVHGTFGTVNVGPDNYEERRKALLAHFGF